VQAVGRGFGLSSSHRKPPSLCLYVCHHLSLRLSQIVIDDPAILLLSICPWIRHVGVDLKDEFFFFPPPAMSSRPIRKIIPSAKLTAENVGDVELTSHRRAIAASTLDASERESTPGSEPAMDTVSSDLVPAHTSIPLKRPRARPLSQATSIQTIADEDMDSVPSKKAKTSAVSAPQAEASVILIDDGDDPKNDRLNKVSATADIKFFFTEVPCEPGQHKARMKCKLCE
jgi:hypothetical protein